MRNGEIETVDRETDLAARRIDGDVDVRPKIAVTVQAGQQPAGGDGRGDADPEGAVPALAGEAFRADGDERQGLCDIGEIIGARRRERQTAGASNEELDPEGLLQCDDAVAGGARRDVQLACRRLEAAMPSGRFEEAQCRERRKTKRHHGLRSR
jgi:hypothetical protein